MSSSGAAALGGHGQRRDALGEKRVLLGEAEGEREVDELRERAGELGRAAGLLGQPRFGRRDEPGGRRARAVTRDLEPRAGFVDAMASSTMTATTCSDCGELWASLRAPSSPYAPASVETNDSVCVGLTPPTAVRVLEYARASSMSAAVPEALSFAPE